jgi:hypothetical protein
MSFFYSRNADRLRVRRADQILTQSGKRKHGDRFLSLRGRSNLPKHRACKNPKLGRRLLMRSRRFRRLKMLPQFEVGSVYTFSGFHDWIIPADMNLLHNDKPEGLRQ